jgi:hypothetical protein
MTDINEPADGGYVAVGLPDGTVEVYHRRDDLAERYEVGDARWGCSANGLRPARSWAELTTLGPIANVGEFVDRQVA